MKALKLRILATRHTCVICGSEGCVMLWRGGWGCHPPHTHTRNSTRGSGNGGTQAHIAQITYYLGQITTRPSAVQQKGAAHKTRTPAHYYKHDNPQEQCTQQNNTQQNNTQQKLGLTAHQNFGYTARTQEVGLELYQKKQSIHGLTTQQNLGLTTQHNLGYTTQHIRRYRT